MTTPLIKRSDLPGSKLREAVQQEADHTSKTTTDIQTVVHKVAAKVKETATLVLPQVQPEEAPGPEYYIG